MAAWVCVGCTTVYSVGAPRCPHCGSTEHVDQGAEDMPKITRHGGASIAGASVIGGAWGEDAPEHPEEEQSWPGSSSETSSEKEQNSPESNETKAPSRARTTGSRSKKARTASSSAGSTAGGREDGTSETGSSADEDTR